MPAAPAAVQHLERPDGRVAWESRGAGPLVVLLPGMGELRSSYRFVVDPLVAAGHRVVAMDLRGHGDSDASFEQYGDTATAGDLRALLEQESAPAVVVGNSLAAGSAVLVAAAAPALVAGLVLIGPFVRDPPQTPEQRAAFLALTAPEGVADRWSGFMPALYAGRKPDDFDDYRAAVRASLARPAWGLAFSKTVRGADHAPADAVLADVAAPVLVVMGELDPDFADPRGEAARIAEVTDGALAMVPDAGHYPQAQQPERVVDAILAALSRLRADA